MSDHCGLIPYSAPEGELPSEHFELRVNDEPVFVYQARVSAAPINQVWPGYQRPIEQSELASFAYWDMSVPVTVEVKSLRPVSDVVIRPLSRDLHPEVEGDVIRFELPRPGPVVVEVNGFHHALHLFANPIEEDVPQADDPKVRYFGPGVHRPGKIELSSNETIYVAGGAVVHTAIESRGASNICIRGRGIIDVSTFERKDGIGAVSLYVCQDIRIEGLIMRDPNVWTLTPSDCDRVDIANVKLVGLWRYNADGIDIVNSRDVTIDKCFVRAFDDCIVIKGLKARGGHPCGDKPLRNVTVTDCVIWNDWGRALEIGAETCAPEVSGIVFRNCDIIRTIHIAMDCQHGDRALVSDVRFEDIRVEVDDRPLQPQMQEAPGDQYEPGPDRGNWPRLLVLEIRENPYSKDPGRGSIRNVSFKNIDVYGERKVSSHIRGFDAEHRVEDVRIEGLRFNGKPVRDAEGARIDIGDNVGEVRFLDA